MRGTMKMALSCLISGSPAKRLADSTSPRPVCLYSSTLGRQGPSLFAACEMRRRGSLLLEFHL